MQKQFLTGLVSGVAVVSSALSIAAPANAAAFTWNNLDTSAQVKDKSTDKSDFQSIISEFQQFVQKEGLELPGSKQKKLDPNKLKLKRDNKPGEQVRVYFLNEGATFKNQLAYQATKDNKEIKKGLVFDDVSCNTKGGANSACQLGSDEGNKGLDIGDYVDIGQFTKDTKLNFWLKADGKNEGKPGDKPIYGTPDVANPDGLDHMVAYEYKGYLMIGFEDLFGKKGATGKDTKTGFTNQQSDRDFNDVVFAVYFGEDNIATSVPEPGSVAAVLGAGAMMFKLRRRRQTQAD